MPSPPRCNPASRKRSRRRWLARPPADRRALLGLPEARPGAKPLNRHPPGRRHPPHGQPAVTRPVPGLRAALERGHQNRRARSCVPIAMHPSPSSLRTLAAPLLVAGATTALVFAAGLVSGHTLFGPGRAASPPPAAAPASASAPAPTLALAAPTALAVPDSCGLPAGITVDALDPADRSFALRRGLLCADRQAGRLLADEYRSRLALLDLAHPAAAPSPTGEPADEIAWASTVRAYSSQYTDSEWSAARVLGAPDVPAAGGDDPNA